MRSHEFDCVASIRRRVLVSITALVGWLGLILLYFAFWASGFTLFESIIVGVVSCLVLGGVLLGAWISFGLRLAETWAD